MVLHQCFLSFLEVLNPTSAIHVFIKPFIVGKIQCAFLFTFKAYVFCISTQSGQAERDVTHRTRWVNETAQPMKLILSPITETFLTFSQFQYQNFLVSVS